MTSLLQSQKTNLGFKGHFHLPEQLLATAARLNITLVAEGQGRYRVDGADVDKLCPSFIERDHNHFSLAHLKDFLEFLHQPVRGSLARNAGRDSHEDRLLIHQALRFITTGSSVIPRDFYESVEKKSADDHAHTERAMRDDDAWTAHQEFANPKNIQSAIPNTDIDQRRGYVLRVSSSSGNGEAHRKLNLLLGDFLEESTGKEASLAGTTIYLNADELNSFVAHIANQKKGEEFSVLLAKVEFEAEVQRRLTNIEDRMRRLAISPAFAGLQTGEAARGKIASLLQATSALVPVIHSDVMQDIWKRYNFSDRNQPALPELGKQLAVLQETLRLHGKAEQLPALQTEAIAQEFYPLLAMCGRLSDVLGRGLQKSSDSVKQEQPPAHQLLRAAESFRTASVAGVALDPAYMGEDAQKILKGIERSMGEDKSSAAQIADMAVRTFKNFVDDIVHFAKENPYAVPACAALVATLYMLKGGTPVAAQNIADSVTILTDSGFSTVAIDPASLPESARKVQSWHWNFGPLGPYKHFAFDNIVKGVSEFALDGMRVGTYWLYEKAGLPLNVGNQFFATAADTVAPVSDQLFSVNLLQNASHAGFWLYVGSKGYQHGYKGSAKIIEFMAPVADLGYQMWSGAKDMIPLGKGKTSIGQRLNDLVTAAPQNPLQNSDTAKFCEQHRCMMYGLVRAAQARVTAEQSLPEPIREASGSLKIAGLKHDFQISAKNLGPVLKALDQFDLVVTHIAGQADMAQPWYQDYLQEKLRLVTNGLKVHQKDGDTDSLNKSLDKHLNDLMGVQMHYMGQASLYKAFFGLDPDQQVAKRLSSAANADFHALNRHNKIVAYKTRLLEEDILPVEKLKLRSAILGTAVWGGLVGAARTVGQSLGRMVNKPMILTAAGLTAAAVAMDVAGYGNLVTNQISAAAGGAAATALTTTVFGIWNIWDDMILNHIGGGAALLVAGATAGYAYKKILRPVAMAGMEILDSRAGIDLGAVWRKCKGPSSAKIVAEEKPVVLQNLHQEFTARHSGMPLGCQTCPHSLFVNDGDHFVTFDTLRGADLGGIAHGFANQSFAERGSDRNFT